VSLDEKHIEFIEQLYVDMYDTLSAYAQSVLDDRSLAEEAVQDTFRIACAKSADLFACPNPKGWLINTMKYVIKNSVRSRSRLGSILMSLIAFDESAAGGSQAEETVDTEYADLIGDEDYALLKKIVFEKYTMLEAAEELGLTPDACKKRIQRAKKRFRDRLGDL